MAFGERLRQVREGAGLSQYRLARVSGVSRRAIIEYEMGRARPRSKNLRRLRMALGDAVLARPQGRRSVLAYTKGME